MEELRGDGLKIDSDDDDDDKCVVDDQFDFELESNVLSKGMSLHTIQFLHSKRTRKRTHIVVQRVQFIVPNNFNTE